MIAQEREAKQTATQFKPGNNAGPDGRKGKEPAESDSPPPVPRDIKKKDEQSTVGQIAKRAEVSSHKVRQVVAVAKAVESGELPKDTIAKVRAGEVKLKDVVPKPIPRIVPPPPTRPEDEELGQEKELAFYHITQSIDKYLKIKSSSLRMLKQLVNTYLGTKGDKR